MVVGDWVSPRGCQVLLDLRRRGRRGVGRRRPARAGRHRDGAGAERPEVAVAGRRTRLPQPPPRLRLSGLRHARARRRSASASGGCRKDPLPHRSSRSRGRCSASFCSSRRLAWAASREVRYLTRAAVEEALILARRSRSRRSWRTRHRRLHPRAGCSSSSPRATSPPSRSIWRRAGPIPPTPGSDATRWCWCSRRARPTGSPRTPGATRSWGGCRTRGSSTGRGPSPKRRGSSARGWTRTCGCRMRSRRSAGSTTRCSRRSCARTRWIWRRRSSTRSCTIPYGCRGTCRSTSRSPTSSGIAERNGSSGREATGARRRSRWRAGRTRSAWPTSTTR